MGIFICDYCGKEFKRIGSNKRSKKHYCCKEHRFLSQRKVDKIYYENNYAYIILKLNNIEQKVLFDIEDIEKVNLYKWRLSFRKSDNRYDVHSWTRENHSKRKNIRLSRYLLNYSGNLQVDHINRNPLDNRKCNLRIVSAFANNLNKKSNKSGCVGVTWSKNVHKWKVMLGQKYFGCFKDFNEAVKIRKEVEKQYYPDLQNNV